jgi:hypothetical protein
VKERGKGATDELEVQPGERVDRVLAERLVEAGVLGLSHRLWLAHPERLVLVELLKGDCLDLLGLGLGGVVLDRCFVSVDGALGLVLERRDRPGRHDVRLEIDWERRGKGRVFLTEVSEGRQVVR